MEHLLGRLTLIFFVGSSEAAAGVTFPLVLAFLGGKRVFNGKRSSLTSSTTGMLCRCFPPRDTTSFCSGTVPLLADRSTVV